MIKEFFHRTSGLQGRRRGSQGYTVIGYRLIAPYRDNGEENGNCRDYIRFI